MRQILEATTHSSRRSLSISSGQTLVSTPPLLSCEVCVIIPVRNEAKQLEETLIALEQQIDFQNRAFPADRYEIIILANNCTDNSAEIVRSFSERYPNLALHLVEKTLPPEEAYVGRVRQLLMDEAYTRLMLVGCRRGIIASTDGDSKVSPTWIAALLSEIGQGADAVGGRIITDRTERASLDANTRRCYLRSVGYHYLISQLEAYLDPDPFDGLPRHHQFFGANFAVTAEAYAAAGGMPAVRSPEDVAFHQALLRIGARIRHSPFACVTTSARQTGRTSVGLANQLSQWQHMGEQQQAFLVEPADAVELRLRSQKRLRTVWQTDRSVLPNLTPIAATLGIARDWLTEELKQPQPFGLLNERVKQRQIEEGIWRQRWTPVRIEEAIMALRLRLYAVQRQPHPDALKLY